MADLNAEGESTLITVTSTSLLVEETADELEPESWRDMRVESTSWDSRFLRLLTLFFVLSLAFVTLVGLLEDAFGGS